MLAQQRQAVSRHQLPSSSAQQPRQTLTFTVAPRAGGGGLFGSLFGGGDKQQSASAQQATTPQQQAAPAPPPQQQPQQQPGTPDNPEFPPYQVLQKGSRYDLRLYTPHPVVEMDYERREQGYLALGSYCDGSANSSSTRFGHTQPVVMCYHPDGRKQMQMMVGSPKNQQQSGGGSSRPDSITSLPAPTDPAVRLAVAGGEIVAVMPFEGYITPDTAASVRKQLVSALEADGLSLGEEEREGYFRVAQYGQVYTLQARLNEMMLKVQL